MKQFFLLILSVFCSSFFWFEDSHAVDTPSPESESLLLTGTTQEQEVLALSKVDIIDSQHLELLFTQPMKGDTLLLKITKQSDNSSVRVASITGTTDSARYSVALGSDLEEGSSFVLRILSAESIAGTAIKDGAFSLKEFITPVPLKRYEEVVVNAPTNTTVAPIIEPINVTSTASITPTVVPLEEETTTVTLPVEPEALPSTGLDTLFLVILAVLASTVLLLRRKFQQ